MTTPIIRISFGVILCTFSLGCVGDYSFAPAPQELAAVPPDPATMPPIITYYQSYNPNTGTANVLSFHADTNINNLPVDTGGVINAGTCAIAPVSGNPSGPYVLTPSPMIDPNTCAISWTTPLTSGTWNYTVTASNVNGPYSGSLQIVITDSCFAGGIPLAIPYPIPAVPNWDDANGDFSNSSEALASCSASGSAVPTTSGFEIELNVTSSFTISSISPNMGPLTVDFASYDAPNQYIIVAIDSNNNQTTIMNTCNLVASSPGIGVPKGVVLSVGRPYGFMVEHVSSAILPPIPAGTVALQFQLIGNSASFMRVSGLDGFSVPTPTPIPSGVQVWNPFPAPTTKAEMAALVYPTPSPSVPCGGPGY